EATPWPGRWRDSSSCARSDPDNKGTRFSARLGGSFCVVSNKCLSSTRAWSTMPTTGGFCSSFVTWCALKMPIIMLGTTMPTGIRITVAMNPQRLTTARYSRQATIQTLRLIRMPFHNRDKNIFERYKRLLEIRDLDILLAQQPYQVHRPVLRLQIHFGRLAVGNELLDQRDAAVVGRRPQQDGVIGILPLDLLDRPIKHAA